jgi:hypothetical protein
MRFAVLALFGLFLGGILADDPGHAPVPSAIANGSTQAVASSAATARFRFGFEDEVICSGMVLDEPKRYRLKCRRAPARAMNCLCGPAHLGASRFACSCHDPVDGSGDTTDVLPAVGNVESDGLRDPE